MPQYDDEELLRWLKVEIPKARRVVRKWRKEEARPAYQFRAGEQWEEEDTDILEDANRTQVTFNRIGPMVQAINGVQVNNRLELDFVPPEPEDKPICEFAKASAKWALNATDAEDQDSHMFSDLATCGMGWTEHYISYEEDQEGKYIEKRRSPFLYLWDVNAVEQNLADARWIMFEMELDTETFEYMFPGQEGQASLFGEMGVESHDGKPSKQFPLDYEGHGVPTDERGMPKKNKVGDLQYWRVAPAYRFINSDGSLQPAVTQEMFDQIREHAGEMIEGQQFIRVPQKHYYRAFITGEKVLEHKASPCDYEFTHLCVTGTYDEIKGCWYGVVRDLKDPQRWINKIFSESVDAYRSSIKGGILREENAVVNEEEWKENVAKPNADLVVREGALAGGKVQIINPTQMSSHLPQLLSMAMSMPQLVSGLNMEFMGLADREQAGVLEKERKLSSMTILAPLFGSFRRYRKQHARLLFQYLQKFFPAKRLQRAVGTALASYVEVFMKADALRYDVMVDESPYSTSVKQYVFELMNTMLQRNPELQAILMKEWIEYSPMPAAISGKLKTALEERAKPDPNREIMVALEMGKVASEIKANLAKAEQAFAKAESEGDMVVNEETRTMLDAVRSSVELLQAAQESKMKFASEMMKARQKQTEAA